jgi:hypothetical protein
VAVGDAVRGVREAAAADRVRDATAPPVEGTGFATRRRTDSHRPRSSIAREIARNLPAAFAGRAWSAGDGEIVRIYVTNASRTTDLGYVRVDADGDLIADGIRSGKERDRVVAALETAIAAIGATVAQRLQDRGGSDCYVLEYATIATVEAYAFVEG